MNPTAQEVPEGLGGPWEWLRGWALGAFSLAAACLEILHRGGEGRAATLTLGSLPSPPQSMTLRANIGLSLCPDLEGVPCG